MHSNAPQHARSQILQLIYCSRSRLTGSVSDREAAIQDLLRTARRNNAADWISGVLLYNGTAFAQVLEGPAIAVERRFTAIYEDPRHTSIVVVSRELIERRVFSSWSMAYVDAMSLRTLSESTIDLQTILATGKSRPGFVLNLLRDVMTMQEQA